MPTPTKQELLSPVLTPTKDLHIPETESKHKKAKAITKSIGKVRKRKA